MGYGDNHKGYWLYDVQKRRIVYSRDVVFNEMSGGLEKSEAESKLVLNFLTFGPEVSVSNFTLKVVGTA